MKFPYVAYLHLPLRAPINDHIYIRLYLVAHNVPFVKSDLPTSGQIIYTLLFTSLGDWRKLQKLVSTDSRLKGLNVSLGNLFEQ